ncbi:uncharacterized protein FIBRA_03666 [Fibroporia radiculosa]|uniref:J domain-containing protein n=1 Tax=Fibroporia radiculosa TaxID=599839 RepID=J4I9R2_9APHY|nr:uncharacterized protein FIBRA_03666 [Fibroporia radiculosa]CCM01606.1 predicted protein [Fibroporia radiculosa]
MRFCLLALTLFALVVAVAAWTKEDHEIFDLVSAVQAAEGKDTTFYSWLGVSSTASTSEIAKAYRKKSIQMHPDKNPGVKNAQDRFARLGVISKILRAPESRERYDFFYKNGVPKWRGTGYYYSRFRPGLGTVFVFLTILSSALQYLVQRMNYKRDLARIEQIIGEARSAAWGSKMTPTSEGQRKVKVNLGGGRRLDENGNLVGGKMVDMIVEGNDVYILEPDGSLLPVDSDTAVPPSIRRTWFAALVAALYRRVANRASTEAENGMAERGGLDPEGSDDGSAAASDTPGSGATTPNSKAAKDTAGLGNGGRAAAAMAGGRRRKAVRKR